MDMLYRQAKQKLSPAEKPNTPIIDGLQEVKDMEKEALHVAKRRLTPEDIDRKHDNIDKPEEYCSLNSIESITQHLKSLGLDNLDPEIVQKLMTHKPTIKQSGKYLAWTSLLPTEYYREGELCFKKYASLILSDLYPNLPQSSISYCIMKFSSQLHLYNRAINIGLHKMITKLDSGSIEQTILPFKQRILSKSIIQLLAIIEKQCGEDVAKNFVAKCILWRRTSVTSEEPFYMLNSQNREIMPYIHLSVTLESYKSSLIEMLESYNLQNVKPNFTYKEEQNGWRAFITVVSKKLFAKAFAATKVQAEEGASKRFLLTFYYLHPKKDFLRHAIQEHLDANRLKLK